MILSGRGAEQQTKGIDTVLAFINLMLALGKVGKPASGYGCLTGQGNGQGGREHGQKADQLPGYRLIEDPEHRAAIAKVWGVEPATLPGKGKSAYELLDALGPGGGIRGLLVFGSNVAVASPERRQHRSASCSSSTCWWCATRSRTRPREHAHVVLPIAQWAEEEGTHDQPRGPRASCASRCAAPPEGVQDDLEILCELAERLGASAAASTSRRREAVFDELRRATAGAQRRLQRHHLRADAPRARACSGPVPATDHPGTPRLFAERFALPDGRARFSRRAAPPRRRGARRGVPAVLHHRPLQGALQLRRADAARAAAARRQAGAARADPPAARRRAWASPTARRCWSRAAAAASAWPPSSARDIRPDTLFAPFHWGGKQAANLLTSPALDPTSRMPEFKVCAVRARAAAAPRLK